LYSITLLLIFTVEGQYALSFTVEGQYAQQSDIFRSFKPF